MNQRGGNVIQHEVHLLGSLLRFISLFQQLFLIAYASLFTVFLVCNVVKSAVSNVGYSGFIVLAHVCRKFEPFIVFGEEFGTELEFKIKPFTSEFQNAVHIHFPVVGMHRFHKRIRSKVDIGSLTVIHDNQYHTVVCEIPFPWINTPYLTGKTYQVVIFRKSLVIFSIIGKLEIFSG